MLHISQKMGFFTQRIKRTGCLSKSKKSRNICYAIWKWKKQELSLANLKYLKNLTFSKKIKIIPECSNSSIENVIIQIKVKVIDESTFDTCKNLKESNIWKKYNNNWRWSVLQIVQH